MKGVMVAKGLLVSLYKSLGILALSYTYRILMQFLFRGHTSVFLGLMIFT